mmetsp:Transcript_105196/g.302508  ORF Transcript_105196/g.302508 Transcript_105196/m.302508 type:complete len:328 (-) Transcript_105196:59-1042(-)|eukprot:CAMPEP_0170204606 /NCGR_PEP_ID=MMETSP0116_2-20130129/1832_1 /TAXON_ID=400756 /ORGANISM="Durinskia baltica, Strain CSIRO CS-38" /LENGTH=327 /DNA_ID=CAMNT_0010454967 /DNA_START=353 /DNA_END=1336 /DNA_ORIENTATION=+
MTPFPWRLHEMLEEIEEKRLNWIVSWTPDGKAFQVHSPEQFTATIVPMYFRHKRYKSFQRQLYLYGFRSMQVNSAAKAGAYFHPLFVKDNRALCRHIVRPKAVSSRKTSSCPKTPQICGEEIIQDPGGVTNRTVTMQESCPQLANPSPVLNSGGVPFMLGQKFEHLPRGLDFAVLANAPLLPTETRSLPCSSRQSGVVSPSVDQDVPGRSNIPEMDFQETATQSLYRSMELAMNERPLVTGADSQYTHQQDTFRDAQDPISGYIYSMSIGNSTAVNFQELQAEKDSAPSASGLQRIFYGSASIQELEPYTDSIITLFGGSADLPYVA